MMNIEQNVPAAAQKPKSGRKPVDFDVAEALRLRRMGWSDRRIARHMHVAPGTVGSRLREWKPEPEPIPSPAAPVQQAHATIQEPSVLSNVQVQVPKAAIPVPVAPVMPPEPPPAPIDNSAALLLRCPWLKVQPLESWTRCQFLVNVKGEHNLAYATNNSQFAVQIERWHTAYRDYPVFQKATKIWVVLDANDDNTAFLQSLVNDIWIREKCVVAVGSVLDLAKFKTDAGVRYKVSFESFERACGFSPMPQPNHVERIQQLLRKPKPAPAPPLLGGPAAEYWRVGGSGASSAYRSSGTPIVVPKRDPNDGSNGNDGSGFAF